MAAHKLLRRHYTTTIADPIDKKHMVGVLVLNNFLNTIHLHFNYNVATTSLPEHLITRM